MIQQSLVLLLISFLLSFALTGLLFKIMTIQGKAKNPMLFVLALLPIVFTYLWNPLSRTLANHGFYHISIVYQIMNNNAWPKDPLLADQLLIYPWGYSFLSAIVTSLFHISPDNSFALINLLCISITIFLIFRIAILVSSNNTVGIFAVILSIFGVFIMNRGPLAEIFKALIPYYWIFLEKRIALTSKFLSVSPTCIGTVFFGLFVYSIIQIFEKYRKVTIYYITLIISFLGAGFLYPQFWPGMIGSCIISCLVMYLRHREKTLDKTIVISICILVTTVIIFPYLQDLASGNSEKIGSNLFNPKFKLMFIKVLRYFWGTLPLYAIILWKRKTFLNLLHRKTNCTLILISIVITTGLMYIFFSFYQQGEYKFYILSWICLGILASVCFFDIYLNNKLICFVLISSLLLSINTELLYFAFGDSIIYPFSNASRYTQWQASDEYVADGMYLRHTNRDENVLYQWIRDNTKKNAYFLDTHLTIPIFAQRQLFVGLDIRRDNFPQNKNIEDGWGIPAKVFLTQSGYSPNLWEKRMEIGENIFSHLFVELQEDLISELKVMTKDRDLYVVLRDFDLTIHDKFKNNHNFHRVFENNGIEIYQLVNK